jgi:predicted ester cyclase
MSAPTNTDRVQTYHYQAIDQAANVAAKQHVYDTMQQLTSAPLADLEDALRAGYHANAAVHATHPVNDLSGLAALADHLWRPLRHAIPDAERRDDIVAGGYFADGHWIGCTGHYVGTFQRDWLGIPATGGVVAVRYGEGHALREGRIETSYIFIDFLDLMRQAGCWPLGPSRGREMRWLPPATRDGVLLTLRDNAVSQQSIERVLHMHAALGRYNGQPPTRAVLDEMEMVKHWHPHFMWYGPAGIGVTRGLKGFEDHHQIPFLASFPDRAGSDVGHFIRIGDGQYAVTGGWGYLQATHSGSAFQGIPATGRRVAMRVMDFYRCDDATIVENWIPFDVPHLLLQMGVDVFAGLRRP